MGPEGLTGAGAGDEASKGEVTADFVTAGVAAAPTGFCPVNIDNESVAIPVLRVFTGAEAANAAKRPLRVKDLVT